MVELKDIKFIKPMPLHHLQPLGLLPNNTEACALWQFLIMAFQALDLVEKQTTLEGAEDQVVDLMQLAHSSRKMFELPDLEGMFNMQLVDMAKREALRSGLSWTSRIDAFFASGGKSYRTMDRDPDKVAQ